MAPISPVGLKTTISSFVKKISAGGKNVDIIDETCKMLDKAGKKYVVEGKRLKQVYCELNSGDFIAQSHGFGNGLVSVNFNNGRSYVRQIFPEKVVDQACNIQGQVSNVHGVGNEQMTGMLCDLLA